MHTFGRYATFTTTRNLVSWRNFFNWGGNSELNLESLIIILSSLSLSSFSPPYYMALIILLWSSLTDTCNNNFRTSFVTIHFHLQTIIWNWWLHELWRIHNPVIKRHIYLFIYFWVPFSLLFQLPWCISKFNFLALRFISSNSTISSFFSHLKH